VTGPKIRRHAGACGQARRPGRPQHGSHVPVGTAIPAAAAGARGPAAPRPSAGSRGRRYPRAPPGETAPGLLLAALAVDAGAVRAGAVRVAASALGVRAVAVHAGARFAGTGWILAGSGSTHDRFSPLADLSRGCRQPLPEYGATARGPPAQAQFPVGDRSVSIGSKLIPWQGSLNTLPRFIKYLYGVLRPRGHSQWKYILPAGCP
jgi:hypothetical protein